MPYSSHFKNKALDLLFADVYASLLDLDPGDRGLREITVRKPISFGPSADGSKTATSAPVFDVSGGSTVSYAGFWDAVGHFLGSAALEDEVFAAPGTYTLAGVVVDLNASQ